MDTQQRKKYVENRTINEEEDGDVGSKPLSDEFCLPLSVDTVKHMYVYVKDHKVQDVQDHKVQDKTLPPFPLRVR